MEEEYIEKIEKTILKCNECKLKECIGCEYTFNDLQPLRYLLKRYKELEEENNQLKEKWKRDCHKIHEIVREEHKIKTNYIPTSVIQNKIEEITQYRDLAREQIKTRVVIADRDSLNYGRAEAHDKDIEVLEELLKEG